MTSVNTAARPVVRIFAVAALTAALGVCLLASTSTMPSSEPGFAPADVIIAESTDWPWRGAFSRED